LDGQRQQADSRVRRLVVGWLAGVEQTRTGGRQGGETSITVEVSVYRESGRFVLDN